MHHIAYFYLTVQNPYLAHQTLITNSHSKCHKRW